MSLRRVGQDPTQGSPETKRGVLVAGTAKASGIEARQGRDVAGGSMRSTNEQPEAQGDALTH